MLLLHCGLIGKEKAELVNIHLEKNKNNASPAKREHYSMAEWQIPSPFQFGK
jgi:hypothetical protein